MSDPIVTEAEIEAALDSYFNETRWRCWPDPDGYRHLMRGALLAAARAREAARTSEEINTVASSSVRSQFDPPGWLAYFWPPR